MNVTKKELKEQLEKREGQLREAVVLMKETFWMLLELEACIKSQKDDLARQQEMLQQYRDRDNDRTWAKIWAEARFAAQAADLQKLPSPDGDFEAYVSRPSGHEWDPLDMP